MTFLDTNILLYAISPDPKERAKAGIAREILGRSNLVLSIQVLQEFYVQATRPTRTSPYAHEDAMRLIEQWLRFTVVEMTVPVLRAALNLKHRYQSSFWDASILAAALSADCRELLSEDFNSGQNYDGLTVTNPFQYC